MSRPVGTMLFFATLMLGGSVGASGSGGATGDPSSPAESLVQEVLDLSAESATLRRFDEQKLLELTERFDAKVRRLGEALRVTGVPASLDTRDRELEVRVAAAALAAMGKREQLAALEARYVERSAGELAARAAIAPSVRDEDVAPELRPEWELLLLRPRDPHALQQSRRRVVEALVRIGDPESGRIAARVLLAMAEAGTLDLRVQHDDRLAALELLARLPSEENADLLGQVIATARAAGPKGPATPTATEALLAGFLRGPQSFAEAAGWKEVLARRSGRDDQLLRRLLEP